MTNFLPEGYQVPKNQGGGYMKLKLGDNKVRLMTPPTMGYEYWNTAGKPVRMRIYPPSLPQDIRINDEGKPDKVKHFWACIVYNYATKEIEILQINQASIQTAITDLALSEEWGDPRNYPITIKRKGEKLETEYSVIPSAPTKVISEVQKQFEEKPINLDALFEGKNPFEEKEDIELLEDVAPEKADI